MKKPRLYYSTLATHSTIDEGKNGKGCVIPGTNGEFDKLEFKKQVYNAKWRGFNGFRIMPQWNDCKEGMIASAQRVNSNGKFDLPMISNQYFFKNEYTDALQCEIETVCERKGGDEIEICIWDYCNAKKDYVKFNPFSHNNQGIKDWGDMDKKTKEVRHIWIDYLMRIARPYIKGGYNIRFRLCNETPIHWVEADKDTLFYIAGILDYAGENNPGWNIPLDKITIGTCYIREELQNRKIAYWWWKQWRKRLYNDAKAIGDTKTMQLAMNIKEMTKRPIHHVTTNGTFPHYREDIKNISLTTRYGLSLDGVYDKIDGERIRPSAVEIADDFYFILVGAQSGHIRYKNIINNYDLIEVLAWDNAFDGSTIEILVADWEELFEKPINNNLHNPKYDPKQFDYLNEDIINNEEEKQVEEEVKEDTQESKATTVWKFLIPKISVDFRRFWKWSTWKQKLLFSGILITILIIAGIIIL